METVLGTHANDSDGSRSRNDTTRGGTVAVSTDAVTSKVITIASSEPNAHPHASVARSAGILAGVGARHSRRSGDEAATSATSRRHERESTPACVQRRLTTKETRMRATARA